MSSIRILRRALWAAMLMILVCACAVAEGEWRYTLGEDGFARITSYTGSAHEASIPLTLDGHDVTAIEGGALAGSTLAALTVPVTVTEIADGAFGDALTVRAHNGSAALRHAKAQGLPHVNLSMLSFTEDAVDFTGISRSDYAYAPGGITLRAAYAKALSPGCVFFLPPDSREAVGNGYQAVSIDYSGEWALVRMAQADVADVLTHFSYHGTDIEAEFSDVEVLDSSVYGVRLKARDAVGGSSQGRILHFKKKLGDAVVEVNLDMSIDELTLAFDTMPFAVQEFSYSVTTSASINADAETEMPHSGEMIDIMRFTFASVYGGMIRFSGVLRGSITAEGEAHLSFSVDQTCGLDYTPKTGWHAREPETTTDLQFDASATFMPKFEVAVAMQVVMLDDFGELYTGLQVPITAQTAFRQEFPETLLCADLNIKIQTYAGAWIGLRKTIAGVPVDLTLSFKTPVYTCEEEEGHFESLKPVERCTKIFKGIFFETGCDVVVPPIPGEIALGTLPPMLPTPVREGYTFKTWALANGTPVSSGFAIPEEGVTLYAVWEESAVATQPKPGDGTQIGVSNPPLESALAKAGFVDWKYLHYDEEDESDTPYHVFSGYIALKPENSGLEALSTLSYAPNYIATCGLPFHPNIQTVVHHDGMLYAGSYRNCPKLQSVTLPAGLKTLEDYAFQNCISLSDVNLPASLEQIGRNAFENCILPSSIILPNQVRVLSSAFYGCSGVTSVTGSPKEISNQAFYGTNALRYVDFTGEDLTIGGSAFSQSGLESANISVSGTLTLSGAFMDSRALKRVTITADEVILNNAFRNCTALESVTINADRITMQGFTFNDCPNLTSVSLNAAKTSLSYMEFTGCVRLTDLTLTGVTEIKGSDAFSGSGITRLHMTLAPGAVLENRSLFANHTLLETLIIEGTFTGQIPVFSNNPNLKTVSYPWGAAMSSGAFENCTALTEYVVPDGVTKIDQKAFCGCTSLKTVTLPDSVSSIIYPYYMFYNCPSLESVWCKSGSYAEEVLLEHGYPLLDPDKNTRTLSFEVGNGTRAIDPVQLSAGSSFALPTASHASLREDDVRQFLTWHYNEGLTEPVEEPFVMPDADTTLYAEWMWKYAQPESYAIRSDTILSSYPGDTPQREIRRLIAYSGGNASLHIPDEYEILLSDCVINQIRVRIPASTFEIAPGAFSSAAYLEELVVDGGNMVFYDDDDVLYSREGTLVHVPRCLERETGVLILPETTTSIGARAFDYNGEESMLYEVRIPESVESVGENAFAGLGAQTRVFGPHTGPVAEAAMAAGINYNPYTVVYFVGGKPVGASSVNAGSLLPIVSAPEQENADFSGWSLSEGGAPIDLNAFLMPASDLVLYARFDSGEEGLTLTLPASATAIGAKAFYGTGFAVVVCPDTLTSIGARAFADCPALTKIVLPASVTDIAPDAFSGCETLTIHAPEGSAAAAFARANGYDLVTE